MTPYSNSRIMRRCGQLGIPYAEAIDSSYFARQGLLAPELLVPYNEGVDGYIGPPERRRPLDSLKTLPHDLHAVRALLFSGPARPLAQASTQHRPQSDQAGVVDKRSSSSLSEPLAMPGAAPPLSESREPTPSSDFEIDLTGIVAHEDDAPSLVSVAEPRARAEKSYIPPELPRERWQVVDRAGYEDSIHWLGPDFDVIIDGDGWLPARPDKKRRRNNDFKERGKNGRRSNRRARSIRDSWVSLDPVACRAWCDAIVGRDHLSERDVDELLAECKGNTSVEDLRIHVTRALEGFGLEQRNDSDVAAALWDHPTDVDPDDLFTALDAALNRSVKLPGTERLTMERARDEAELQALLAARQELAQDVLSHDSALQAAISLRLSGKRDCSSEIQTLSSWIDSGRPTHGKAWRAAVSAVEKLRLSEADYPHVVNESELKHQHQAASTRLIRSRERYTIQLRNTRTRYLPYVRRLVSRSLAGREQMEDAFQAATIGLFEALDRLNGKSAVSFRYYASWWINQAFLEWRAHHGGPIHIPVNRLSEMRDFKRALMTVKTNSNRFHDQQLLADQLGWSLARVAKFELLLRTAVRLPSHRDTGVWGASPVADYLTKELRSVIDRAMASYDERDAKVIRLYFGLETGHEHTLEEIGSMFGVTRERIRQLRDRMLDRLKHAALKTELACFAKFEEAL
jgi:RNA polymerase sigma factor (sigma-70 family)